MSSDAVTPVDRRPSGLWVFILISLLLHVPLFIYPVLRLCHWLDLGLASTLLILLPVAFSQVVSRWLLRNVKHPVTRGLRHIADFVLGMSPLLLMTLLTVELPVLAGLLAERTAALLVIGVALVLSIAGLGCALFPIVRPVAFAAESLKAPLRFVQITDVHIGSRNRHFLERVIARVKRLNPDFLCITGDFIDATGVEVEELAALRSLECPIYFCIGNHERYEDLPEILERLVQLGVIVLRNRSIFYRDDVQVIGIDDRDDALQVERQLSRIEMSPDAFKLLMYHRPKGLEAAAAKGIDLMISGHTHNGQIFPFNMVVGRVFDKIVGLYQLDRSRLYVSQGTGTWGPVMRVGTRAEITLFEIGLE